MGTIRVSACSISLDGYGAAPGQSLEHPFGRGGMAVTTWMKETRFFHEMTGQPGGAEGVDHALCLASMEGVGAWIMGRNMFTPARGAWDLEWKGWLGPNPHYHVPVFVLTHHARPSLAMEGGNVFHFVTGGIHEALKRAREAAGGKDVRIGGGAQTVRQYLKAGLIDEAHFAVSPVLLGAGTSPLNGLDLPALGYQVAESRMGENALHVFIRKQEAA